MLTLLIRTDKPESELYLYDTDKLLDEIKWTAHRELAETIHVKIKELLENNDKNLDDLQHIVVFQGPGSFTGLRIGMSVANALAYSLEIPVLATNGSKWMQVSLEEKQLNNFNLASPIYGSEPHITEQKK